MNILIDTHVLLWLNQDEGQLPSRVRDLLSDSNHQINYSVVSLWEIAIKMRSGKLNLAATLSEFAIAQTHRVGLRELEVTAKHILSLHSLPHPLPHNDPFDHLLIAQALSEGLTLVSKDRRFRAYPAVPLVW